MTKDLDVVIVTYNSGEVLQGLLDTLEIALQGLANTRVIIADNDSRDASMTIAERHPINARVLQVGYNAGYSAGINAAVRSFGREGPLLLLNADIRLQPDCIRRMLGELFNHHAGVVVPRIRHEDGTLAYSVRREPSLLTAWSEALLGGSLAGSLGLGEICRGWEHYAENQPIQLASGAIMLVSAEARHAVGQWDERYFLYSEEVDYQRHVREAGFEVRFAADAVCTHIGGESNVNPTLFALLTANRVRYYRRYHGPVATFVFRVAVSTGAALRYLFGPTHRAALRASWMNRAAVARLVPSPKAAAALIKEF